METRTEFGLLGPVMVSRGGQAVPVPPGSQRAVLAALLLSAGQAVSVDELTEVLWGETPPASARVAVQNHVMRLRKSLGGTECRIATEPHGYRIEVEPGQLDVSRFAVHLDAARDAARDGSWGAAAAEARAGLALWRGQPLADVSSDLLAVRDVPRLAEMRLQALETRIDADMHLGRHTEVIPELRQLIVAHPLRERLHGQLMLALYRDGRQAEALAAFQHARDVVIEELGTDPGAGLRELHRQILSGDSALTVAGTVPPAGEPAAVVPYRGLSAFGEQDAGLFFGREEATARVLAGMSSCLDAEGLVIVSGVSGAGKSSLLQAGVVPGLRRAGLTAAPEARVWPCLVFTPGRSPLGALAVQVAPLIGVDASALREQLAADPAGFALTSRQAALSGGAEGEQRRIVLVVDQCEQLFTACESAQEREAFVTALHAAATGERPGGLVVLAVRADFEARLAEFPQLARAVQDRYLLTAMTRRQLRLAITGPAAAAGCGVAEDLVQVLLEEAGARTADPAPQEARAGAGGLPLLSHALDQAWRARAGQQLTLADYERAGGIDGAVAASCQRAYDLLSPAQQHAARQIFTLLAVPGPDGTDTALPAPRADLTASMNPARAKDVDVVLERFAAERLLTLDAGTVAVSHEIVLAAWPLLRDDWLADARADRHVRARLHATATEWAQDSRDPSYLYRGSRLEAAAATAARITADPRQLPLSQADTEFLHASHRAGRRRVRARQQLTAVLLALLAALTTTTVVALRAGQAATAQRNIAMRAGQAAAAQRNIAISRLLISQAQADADSTTSRLQAIAAWALNPSPQARDALLTAAANPQTATITAEPAGAFDPDHGVFAVAFSPDGKTLAAATESGIRLWNLATGQQTGKTLGGADDWLWVAFSHDGKTLAAGAALSRIRVWDLTTGRSHAIPGYYPAAFSPDGNTIAADTSSVIGSGVGLWDAATGRQIAKPFGVGGGGPVAFSPNGKALATAGRGGSGVQVFDLAAGRQVDRTLGGSTTVQSLTFSPDGKALAILGVDGTVWLWDVSTGSRIGGGWHFESSGATYAWAPDPSLAFSPDGKSLATVGTDTPRLWDVATGQQIAVPVSSNGNVINVVAFSPDGKTLATAGEDDRVRLWNVAALTFRHVGPPPPGSLTTPLAFSPGGKILAAGGYGPVQLWDLATGRHAGEPLNVVSENGAASRNLCPLSEAGTDKDSPACDVTALAFSPDGKTLAAGGALGIVSLWNTTTGRPADPPIQLGSTVVSMAFSSDGKLITVDLDKAQRWDVSTGRQIGKAIAISGPSDTATSEAISPDGQTLAIGNPNSHSGVTLWNLTTGQQTGPPLSGTAQQEITSMAFGPDGQTLAIGGQSGAQLWDVATGQQIGHPLTGSPVNVVAYSPDGKTVAAVGSDGIVLYGVVNLTDVLAQMCTQAGVPFSPAVWARYIPAGTSYRNPCSQTEPG